MRIFINDKKIVDCDPVRFYELIEGARFDLDYTPIITNYSTKKLTDSMIARITSAGWQQDAQGLASVCHVAIYKPRRQEDPFTNLKYIGGCDCYAKKLIDFI